MAGADASVSVAVCILEGNVALCILEGNVAVCILEGNVALCVQLPRAGW